MIARHLSFGVLALAVAGAGILVAQESEHAKKVAAWRAQHETDYRRDWVPLAGLLHLKAGENTVGGASSNDIALPQRLPATIGRMVLEAGRVTFHPASSAKVLMNGRPLTTSATLKSDADSEGEDELAVGDVSFWVHMDGDRPAIRVRDPQGEYARSFTGFRWFAIDERYRAVGTFVKDPAPRMFTVPSITGDPQDFTSEGVVEFTLNGRKLRLRPMTSRPGRFFFFFRDATSGKDTYEAARFLYSDLNADGTTVLDFNEAYNPPCAFNPYTTCPVPLPENRLDVPISAGERDYLKPSTKP